MSKVVKTISDRLLCHIVECNGKFYYVDSSYTIDHGHETMGFTCDANGKNIDWGGVCCEWHDSFREMENKHNYIINHLEEFLDEEECDGTRKKL